MKNKTKMTCASAVRTVLSSRKRAAKNNVDLYSGVLKTMGVKTKEITAKDLLKGMKDGLYPNWDSVSALSRKARKGGI